MKKVTMRDVAKKANVSLATVSRALSGTGYIKQDTMELVINACKELGYTSILRNMNCGTSANLIGVITADLKNEFNVFLIEGITKIARQHNYEVIVYDQQEDPKRSFQALDVFSKIPLNGIILTPVMDTTTLKFEYLGMLEKLKVPLVLVDRDLQYSHFDGVFLDNVYGGFDATMALIKAGHTKIATITGTHSSLTGHDRLTGYKKAMQIQKLNLRKEYIKSGEFTIEGGYEGIRELMDMQDPPTAVFVANSVMMKGALRLIQERNMKIPEDIAILSFDDLLNHISVPNLSVVSQPMKEMGEKAMELLLDRICEPSHYTHHTIRIVLNPTIILRGSEIKVKKQNR